MAITLNDNLQINAGKPVDSKYLSSSNVPYASVAAANSAIPISYRYQGLKVNINNVEYWYYTGVTDGDLVALETPESASGITAAENGLTKLGDGKTVVLGGDLTGATTININSQSLAFSTNPIEYAGNYSSQYDALSIPDAGYVTGLTSGLAADIGVVSAATDTNAGNIVTVSGLTVQNASDIQLVSGVTTTNAGNIVTVSGLTVDNANDIAFITANTINTANNGLTKDGTNVRLGGDLTGDTTVDLNGFDLIFATSAVTYAGDYSDSFTNRSLVDKEYVDNSSGAISADNGLTRSGDNIVLGGTLTGDTKVDLSTFGVIFGDTGSVSSGASSVVLAEGIAGGACSVAIANGCAYGADSIAFADGQAQCDQTFAFGTGSIASGASSAAFGSNSCTTACGAFAFGVDVMATGQQSVAFGSGTTSSGPNSFTFGCGAIASGDNALAFGSSCAIGDNSWAAGGNSCANGQGAVIIAGCGESNGYGSFAFGNRVCADANGAFAFGSYVNAIGVNSFAFGIGTSTRPIVASGVSAINFSNNTGAQKEGHGADAPYSVILGGINHHIDEKVGVNTGAAIIGRYGTTGIILSGATNYEDHTVVPHFAIWGTPQTDNDGDILVRDAVTKKIGITSIEGLGGVTGGANGLEKSGSNVVLGGTLTATTTSILGATCNLSLGTSGSRVGIRNDFSASHVIDATTCAEIKTTTGSGVIAIDAQSNSDLYIRSQAGTTTGPTAANSIGIVMDYLGNDFTIIDNRVGANASGIQYQTDYSDNYDDRSLVDKAYVDSVAAGLDAKDAVNVATTPSDGDIDVTGGTFVSGTTLDGVVVEDGWRVLVKNQTDNVENGIWVYSASTSAFTRSDDFDGTPVGEVSNGAYCLVITGDTLANSQWVVTTPDPITVGVTGIDWSLLSQQLGIQAGTGITVTTVNSNNTISVKLAGSASALCFGGSLGLAVDPTIAGIGSSMSGGVIDLSVESAAATGNEIPVQIDAGGTNVLMVDSDDVASALGTPITTANNGLTKAGSIVSLGGTLTGNTTINGSASCHNLTFTSLGTFDLGFDGPATITDQGASGGLKYAANYCNEFTALSLPDVQYVTGLTDGLQTQITANANNIASNDADISYLSGQTDLKLAISDFNTYSGATDTRITTNENDIAFITANTINTASNGLTKTGTDVALGGDLTETTVIQTDVYDMAICSDQGQTIQLVSSTGTTATTLSETAGSFSVSAGDIAGQTNCLTIDTDNVLISSNGTTFTGAEYDKDYSDNFTARSLVDKAYVDASTGGIGAENGLTKDANGNIVLGGDLTGATTININSNSLAFSTNPIEYAGDYSSQYDALSIPDAGYVTGLTNGLQTQITANDNDITYLSGQTDLKLAISDFNTYSGATDTRITTNENDIAFITANTINTANNGLTKDGTNVRLGGTLTGDTCVDTSGFGMTFGGRYGSYANGANSFVAGVCNVATGNSSIAMGCYAYSMANFTIAGGYFTSACGNYGVALGVSAYSCGISAIALGNNAKAEGACSFAAQSGCATGNGSFAFGQIACATSCGALAWNLGSTASGSDAFAQGSVAIGCNVCTLGIDSKAIGKGIGTGNKQLYACGAGAVVISENTAAQISGHGALAPNSIILGGINHNIESGNTRAAIVGGNGIKLTGSDYVDYTAVPNLAIFSTPDTGTFSDGILVWDSADKKIKQVASTVIGGITGASNGLNVVDKEVKLGGALTEATAIDNSSFDLTISGTSALYDDDYSSTYVARSLVDAEYVTGLTSGLAADIGVVSAATDTNAADIVTVSGLTVQNASDIQLVSGVTTTNAGNIAINTAGISFISGVTDTNSAEIDFISANTVNNVDNGLTKVGTTAILGGDLTGNTTVGLAGFSLVLGSGSTVANTIVVNNLAIEDSPDTGSATTDAVLVWNSTDKKVKQVDASNLGEDNNLYNITGVSSTVTLTASEYVVVGNTSGGAFTINLPAAPATGRAYKIKDSGDALSNNLTISGNGNNIDGAATAVINTDYGALELVFDGSEWFTLAFIN